MGRNLYVGNLPFDTTEGQLREMFEHFGSVESAQIITERETGRSRGFAFVKMGSDDDARRAIEGLNGQSVMNRPLLVDEARSKGEIRGGADVRHDRQRPAP